MIRRRQPYAPRGAVAMPAKAWGDEFAVMLFGEDEPRAPFREEGSYAVVDVCGPLSQKPGWWSESYPEIRDRVAAALASQCAAVCLKIDSPGGDYGGALELSRDLRSMASASGKKLVAFTDSMALSAGYALACAASEIVTTESGQVGSIGVWAPLVDVTAQDAMYGVKFAFVASGAAKVDRNPHVGITDEAFARLQGQIDAMAANFFALVAQSRPGVSADQARALDGAEFFGSRGQQAGLSDRIVNSWSSFISGVESAMPIKAKTDTYKEALTKAREALQKCAEGDDEDAKKAKETLAALEEPEKEDKTGEPPKPKEEGTEEEKKMAEEKEKEAARSVSLKLAAEVAALSAKLAARDAADAKAKADAELAAFFATRPDLSEDQRKTLDGLPLERVKAVVATWPRVHAGPDAARNAIFPITVPEPKGIYTPRLSAEQQALIDGARGGPTEPEVAHAEGSSFVTPFVTKEQARKRLEAMKKGVA